jgi:hypothetical protein
VAVFALAVGCGGDEDSSADGGTVSVDVGQETVPPEPDQEPGEFLEDLLGYYFKGQYGRAWEVLHPGHKAIVSRSKFDECVSAGFPSSAELSDVDVVEEYDEPISLPHVPEKTSKAVTLRLTVRSGEASETDTDTYHAVDVGGRWAWVLESQDVAAYERGECPP